MNDMKNVFGGFLLLTLILACGSDDTTENTNNPSSTFDRSAMLANWADAIIIPGYQDFDAQVDVMVTAVAAFQNDPTALTLTDLRGAWVDAYKTWQRVSMFEIGPAENVNFRLNVNSFPANSSTIDANANSGIYDFSLPSNRAAKGFPALDYLLYGKSDQELLDWFTGADGVNVRGYVVAVVQEIKTLSTTVKNEWENGYRATFIENDGASATASVDRFVNDYIFYFEKFLRAGKMGIPAGVFSGDVLPQNEEAFYHATLSKELFLESIDAVSDFFNGNAYHGGMSGESLFSYLDELNTIKDGVNLGDLINAQFDTARSSVAALGLFKDELQVNPPIAFLNAYDEVQKIVPLFKIDMVSAMSINIDFTDADGD